jgi:hypothetical protein
MRILTIMLFLLLSAAASFAQIRFEVRDAPGYDIIYEVEKCASDYCDGDLKVDVRKKGSRWVSQQFKLETDFSLFEGKPKPGCVRYRDQSVVRLYDVNFDGVRDLMIQNGRYGGYSGPSYDVYLYSPKAKKFVMSEKLSSLATGPYLGMFEVDDRKRVIRTSQKSGCCMHQTEEFRFRADGRLQKVFDQYEYSFTTNGKVVEVTTRRLVNGKWRKRVTYRKVD